MKIDRYSKIGNTNRLSEHIQGKRYNDREIYRRIDK